MYESESKEEYSCFRAAIDAFLHDRLQTKLGKLPIDDPWRPELIAEHQRGPWLRSAARRVKEIQAVTHSLKAIHPDARGTNLYVAPSSLPMLEEVGSHALGDSFSTDVVGNAGALAVYKLLKLEVRGSSLLQALIANETEALRALDDDPAEAESLREALISLTAEREGGPSSDFRVKQLYWLTGDDANRDAQYHLIAPLFPASLAHRLYEEVQDARFGESNRLARQARRDGLPHDAVYREYHSLAVRRLGGAQPQVISQLNLERRGNNYLLSSLPPVWNSQRNYLPVKAKSIFDRTFGARPLVRAAIDQLQKVLLSDRPKNMHVRDRVYELRNRIVDELTAYADELLYQPAGWSRDPLFEELAKEEQLWLDPLRAELRDEEVFASQWLWMDWPAQVGKSFGNWLNGELRNELPDVGYPESREWRKTLLGDDSSWTQHLRSLRERLDAPNYIPWRKTHDELTLLRASK